VAHEAQLAWERRVGRPAAAAAFASAVFLVAGTIVRQAVALESRPDNDAEFLLAVSKESSSFLISGICQSLNFVALGIVLWFLFRVVRYRRPALQSWVLPLVIVGPLLLAVAGIVSDVDRIDIADTFTDSGVTEGRRGEERAEDLLDDRAVIGTALGAGGTIALAFSMIMIGLHGMRAGVLSRFLGIIGIIVGALYVLPIFGGPLVVQIFWLGALGAVFLGYWPGGRGPAWESGEADPWPTRAEIMRQQAEERGPAPEEEPEAQSDEELSDEEPERTEHPVSKKRKRKKRR
jgi:Domain of unknown function (DUF4386)